MEHLQIEGRIVCENTGRIIMDMESISHGFHDDRLVFIRNDPVEACGRHLRTKRCSDKIQIEAGRVVISDRYVDSSIAYQGYGRGMGDIIEEINMPATGGLRPDLTVLLATDTSRMRERRSADEEDRMDAQKAEFHAEVMKGYMKLAEREPERIRIVDGQRGIDEIAADISEIVDRLLEEKGIV